MTGQTVLNELQEFMGEEGISAALIARPETQWYLTGFRALLYSRPIMLVVGLEQTCLIVPGLEEAHARDQANADHLLVYYEHPKEHASYSHLPLLRKAIQLIGGKQRLGVEFDVVSYGLVRELLGSGLVLEDMSPWFAEVRMVKSEEELALIRQAARLTCVGVEATLAHIEPGRTELEVEYTGNHAILTEAARLHPRSPVDLFAMTQSGPERTLLPHVFSGTEAIATGHGVIHSRQVGLANYRAECERTILVGRPSREQARIFDRITEAQQAALGAVRAGARVCDVDRAARLVLEREGLEDYFIHRAGHGIGQFTHEAPYLRFDSELRLLPNMVICVEPAVYVPGIGGFRHSDTVVVTPDGFEMITEYPRAREQLTL